MLQTFAAKLRFTFRHFSEFAMNDFVFCSCCRVHHARAEMQAIDTPRGKRWRCRRSILAAQSSVSERDAFGRRQSEINRELARRLANRQQPPVEQKRQQWLGEHEPSAH